MTRYVHCPQGSIGQILADRQTAARKPNRTQKAVRSLEFERAMNGVLAIIGAEVLRDGSPDPWTLASGLRWRLTTVYGPLDISIHGVDVFCRFAQKITDPAARLRLGLSQHCDKWNAFGFDYRDGNSSLEAEIAFHRRRLESVIDGTA